MGKNICAAMVDSCLYTSLCTWPGLAWTIDGVEIILKGLLRGLVEGGEGGGGFSDPPLASTIKWLASFNVLMSLTPTPSPLPPPK